MGNEGKKAPAWLAEAIIMIGVAGLYFFVGRPWFQSRAVGNWKTVSGTVVSSAVKEEIGEAGDEFRPEIHYSYSIDGKTYEGKRYEILAWARPEAKAKAIVSQFPVGAPISVFVNPENPNESVLSGKFVLSWLALIISLAFVAFGAMLLFD